MPHCACSHIYRQQQDNQDHPADGSKSGSGVLLIYGLSLIFTYVNARQGCMCETATAEMSSWNHIDCIHCLIGTGTRDSCARTGGKHRVHEEERGRRGDPQRLQPIWPPRRSVIAELNLRMTDAANQRRVGEVKLRSIRWPFSSAASSQSGYHRGYQ